MLVVLHLARSRHVLWKICFCSKILSIQLFLIGNIPNQNVYPITSGATVWMECRHMQPHCFVSVRMYQLRYGGMGDISEK